MKQTLLRVYCAISTVLATLLTTAIPVLAANPLTGDERGQMLNIVIGLLVVSVILIVAFAVMGAKKKKK